MHSFIFFHHCISSPSWTVWKADYDNCHGRENSLKKKGGLEFVFLLCVFQGELLKVWTTYFDVHLMHFAGFFSLFFDVINFLPWPWKKFFLRCPPEETSIDNFLSLPAIQNLQHSNISRHQVDLYVSCHAFCSKTPSLTLLKKI